MPAGRPKGTPRTGGRAKGTPNKATASVQQTLDRLGVDPFEGMAMIAKGEIPCGACHGVGQTKVKAADGTFYNRTCESCYGTNLEKVSPETRAKMYAELAQYVAPKRKAIELSGQVSKGVAESILESRNRRLSAKE